MSFETVHFIFSFLTIVNPLQLSLSRMATSSLLLSDLKATILMFWRFQLRRILKTPK
ncbi:unnamed protein product [Brassica rapa subsp. trilocularis]